MVVVVDGWVEVRDKQLTGGFVGVGAGSRGICGAGSLSAEQRSADHTSRLRVRIWLFRLKLSRPSPNFTTLLTPHICRHGSLRRSPRWNALCVSLESLHCTAGIDGLTWRIQVLERFQEEGNGEFLAEKLHAKLIRMSS